MKKTFDCVDMKNTIQRRLQAEEESLSHAEKEQRRRQRIDADPILGPWLARQRQPPASRETTNR